MVSLVGRLGALPLHTSLIVYPLHLGDRTQVEVHSERGEMRVLTVEGEGECITVVNLISKCAMRRWP